MAHSKGSKLTSRAAGAAAEVLERPLGGARKRAPKQEGRRAQITVPAPVFERAETLADLVGTTVNDVLAILAAKGMQLADRQLETALIGAERMAAFRDRAPIPGGAKLPSDEELAEAAKLLRQELDSPED